MLRSIETGEEITDLLGMYLADRGQAPGRPWVLINFVTSIDGATKVRGGSTGLNDDDDKMLFGVIRAMADVVLVGAGTVRAEDYGPVTLDETRRKARQAAGLEPTPNLVIVTGSLNLDPEARVFSDPEHRPMILTGSDVDRDRHDALSQVADVVRVKQLDARGIIGHLRVARVVLCEGGPSLAGQLAGAGLVDEVNWTIAPVLVSGQSSRMAAGPEVLDPPQSMTLQRAMVGDRSLFLRYVRSA